MTHHYVDPDGHTITQLQWAATARDCGAGLLLAESVVPGPDGDVVVRTTWIGICVPAIDVRPYGTAFCPRGSDGPWRQMEQYDSRTAAERGHNICAMNLARKDD